MWGLRGLLRAYHRLYDVYVKEGSLKLGYTQLEIWKPGGYHSSNILLWQYWAGFTTALAWGFLQRAGITKSSVQGLLFSSPAALRGVSQPWENTWAHLKSQIHPGTHAFQTYFDFQQGGPSVRFDHPPASVNYFSIPVQILLGNHFSCFSQPPRMKILIHKKGGGAPYHGEGFGSLQFLCTSLLLPGCIIQNIALHGKPRSFSSSMRNAN